MGIQDRDYYRESTQYAWSEWFGQRGCVSLIAVTTAVYVLQLVTRDATLLEPDRLCAIGEFDVRRIMAGEVWRLLTSIFLHDPRSPLHLIFNMFALYWFGTEVERIYGAKEFVAVYLSVGFLVGLIQFSVRAFGWLNPDFRSIGASGAVTAMLVLFACHYPHRELRIYFFLPIPAWLFAAGFILLDVLGFIGHQRDGINHMAHLLGAALGFLYYITHVRVSNLWPALATARPKLRLVVPPPARPEPRPPARRPAESQPEPTPTAVDEQLEAKLDQVLAKVTQYGKESLNPAEQQILMRASEVFKRRRNG